MGKGQHKTVVYMRGERLVVATSSLADFMKLRAGEANRQALRPGQQVYEVFDNEKPFSNDQVAVILAHISTNQNKK